MRKSIAVICFVALGSLIHFAWANPAIAQQTYVVTDLGDLPGGGDYSEGWGINSHGHVVGVSDNDSSQAGFLWEDATSGMQSLEVFGGTSDFGFAKSINNNGVIAGYSSTNVTTPLGIHAAIWENGTIRDIGALPGRDKTYAESINDLSQVVGYGELTTSSQHAFYWDDATGMQDLGDFSGGSNRSNAVDINNSTQVVGWGTKDTGRKAFLWEGGELQDLGFLDGYEGESWATGINDAGLIVGSSRINGGATHGFLWENGVMQDLGDLGGGSSFALGINNSGQVVGTSRITGGGNSVFYWDESVGMIDLNLWIDDPNWTLQQALEINDAGQIVGWGTNPDGNVHGFLLTPAIPEPTSSLVLWLITISVSCRRRRHSTQNA